VIDAHPLVRRAFEYVLGPGGRQQGATARAGFLRGRPDRSRPNTLAEAGKEIELFHAFCDAGLWTEADSVLVALENPKHRLLAPVLERDLLLQFFPAGDWRQPPRWPGFGRWRSLAICFELLGQYEEALAAYRPADAPLRGDAFLARGELATLLAVERVGAPWDNLWQAYRCHALCLAGQTSRAVPLARSLIPLDIYEWVHVFECLLRADALEGLDPATLAASVRVEGQRWAELARRRMRADLRRRREGPIGELGGEYETMLEAYDQAGLPWERTLTRLSLACWHRARGEHQTAGEIAREALQLARRYGLRILALDALTLLRESACSGQGAGDEAVSWEAEIERGRAETGFRGPARG
jgi:tetratricopeptide (TPR) repeat protein